MIFGAIHGILFVAFCAAWKRVCWRNGERCVMPAMTNGDGHIYDINLVLQQTFGKKCEGCWLINITSRWVSMPEF